MVNIKALVLALRHDVGVNSWFACNFGFNCYIFGFALFRLESDEFGSKKNFPHACEIYA